MGVVYLAENVATGGHAAIKVLQARFAQDPDVVGRFKNEARVLGQIRHSGILKVYDIATLPGRSEHFLIMELLEGATLAERLRSLGSERLRMAEAVDIARQTASAVAAAHKKGIVHRDLKPENLFLVPEGDDPPRERIKVLDFGIAKLRAQAGLSGLSNVKATGGMLLGTPLYMSPEQSVGAEIDERTDVYALGCILFEMLCGEPPFTGRDVGELVAKKHTEQPPAPSKKRPGVPPHVDAAVLRALARRPEDRWKSMAEFQAALAREPVQTLEGAGAVVGPVDRAAGTEPMFAAPTGPKGADERITTFSRAAGALEPVPLRPGWWRRPAAIAIGVALVGSAVALALSHGGGQEPRAASAPPAPVRLPAMAPPGTPVPEVFATPPMEKPKDVVPPPTPPRSEEARVKKAAAGSRSQRKVVAAEPAPVEVKGKEPALPVPAPSPPTNPAITAPPPRKPTVRPEVF
jgi:serine/threonine-protein kinase